MNGVWMAAGGFIGATFGTILTGFIVEWYRQRNRLQLAAIDKRLEALQEAYQWVVEISAHILALQATEEEEVRQKTQAKIQTMRSNANKWLRGHYLYLGYKVGQEFLEGLRSDDLEQWLAARNAITREVGLPSLSAGWQSFGFGESRKRGLAAFWVWVKSKVGLA